MSELTHILTVCWYIVEICLGVGFVIFVHELGHFAVAKFCGVKCEKFYLGFDIGGWKFCKFRWGETEYGIGILPLGGYVKMLGQEDNPTKLKEEIERAKLQQTDANAASPSSSTTNDQQPATDFDLAEAEQALYDPRSYLAKSVPKRMAIISAGVIMNVIFGFLMAVTAYSMGVSLPICAVGETFPGEAGWRAGLRPGDKILEVAGQKVVRFKDLQKNITLGDISNGVPLLIERPGEKEPLKIVVRPDRIRELPTIGIASQHTTKVVNADASEFPYVPHTAAAKAEPPLKFDDRITMIDGERTDNYQQLQACLANNPEKPLHLTVDCVVSGEKNAPASTKQVEVTVPPQPMRTLGMVMAMGEIRAVRDDSSAMKAGIRPGDIILKIDGSPTGDPMRLPDVLRRRTGETITLTIFRKDSPKPAENPIKSESTDWLPILGIPCVIQEISVKLDSADWFEPSVIKNAPVSIPQLGIAYHVLNFVEQVVPGGPADKAGIVPGTTIIAAAIKEKKDNKDKTLLGFDFSEEYNWPVFFSMLQSDNPDLRIELTTIDKKTFELPLADATDWFNPDRGFLLEPETAFHKASSMREAVRYGTEETWESMTMVLQILHGMGSGRISPTNLGGPGTIFWAAYLSAKRGFPTLLLFLTMLSANLAVLNVLPIPMLDGGHLVFLSYEGIRGKPANERVQIALSIMGLILLLALMIFVCGMDVKRFIFH